MVDRHGIHQAMAMFDLATVAAGVDLLEQVAGTQPQQTLGSKYVSSTYSAWNLQCIGV